MVDGADGVFPGGPKAHLAGEGRIGGSVCLDVSRAALFRGSSRRTKGVPTRREGVGEGGEGWWAWICVRRLLQADQRRTSSAAVTLPAHWRTAASAASAFHCPRAITSEACGICV